MCRSCQSLGARREHDPRGSSMSGAHTIEVVRLRSLAGAPALIPLPEPPDTRWSRRVAAASTEAVKMNGGLDPRRELPGIPLSLTSLPWPWTGGARRTHLGETCPGSIRCSGGTRAGSKSWRPISTRTSSHSTRCSGANSGSRPGISAPKCRFNLTHDGAGSLSVLPESKQSQQSVHDYDRIGKQPTNHHTRSIDTGGVGH